MNPQVSSLMVPVGPFDLQDSMPFSMALVEEYISLRPSVLPLPAKSVK